MRRGPLGATVGAVLLGGAGIAIALSGGDGATPLPTPPPRDARLSPGDHLLVERHWLDQVGTEAIGPGYACSVVLPRRGPREGRALRTTRLVVFVADASAERRAAKLVERLAWPERKTTVKRTSPRFRMHVMKRIRDEVTNTIPANRGSVGVGLMGFVELRRGDCPPLAIDVQLPGQTTPAIERWVSDAVRRYGADRIRVRRTRGKNTPA
jgi:hypothetical protein